MSKEIFHNKNPMDKTYEGLMKVFFIHNIISNKNLVQL